MRNTRFLVVLALPFLAGGCIANTVADVVTAPVKVVSRGVDMATTSQSEADEKRGRALRERDERIGKLSRQRDREIEKCRDGNDSACVKAQQLNTELRTLLDE